MIPCIYSADQRRRFREIFKVDPRAFWDNITGFDVIEFDDFIQPPDGTSTEDTVREKYGQAGVDLVKELIDLLTADNPNAAVS